MKEYISQEQADRIAANLELQQGFTKRGLYRLCNAVRADFIKELLGMDVEPAGTAAYMPGTTGYTMAAFRAEDVPVGTSLLTTTQAAAMRLQEREKQTTEDDVKWVVNDLGELGVCVNGHYFFLYKGESLEYGLRETCSIDGYALHDDGTQMMVRMVGKREFGEVCHPVIHMKVENGEIYDKTPIPYRQELTYTPGLSFGKPEDGAWRPLPAAIRNRKD